MMWSSALFVDSHYDEYAIATYQHQITRQCIASRARDTGNYMACLLYSLTLILQRWNSFV